MAASRSADNVEFLSPLLTLTTSRTISRPAARDRVSAKPVGSDAYPVAADKYRSRFLVELRHNNGERWGTDFADVVVEIHIFSPSQGFRTSKHLDE